MPQSLTCCSRFTSRSAKHCCRWARPWGWSGGVEDSRWEGQIVPVGPQAAQAIHLHVVVVTLGGLCWHSNPDWFRREMIWFTDLKRPRGGLQVQL